MARVTISEQEYKTLRKKTELYERVFKEAPERIFGIERYSNERIRQFLKEDKIDKRTIQKLRRRLQK